MVDRACGSQSLERRLHRGKCVSVLFIYLFLFCLSQSVVDCKVDIPSECTDYTKFQLSSMSKSLRRK